MHPRRLLSAIAVLPLLCAATAAWSQTDEPGWAKGRPKANDTAMKMAPVPAFPIGDRMDDPLKLYAVDILTVPANLAAVPGISFPCGATPEGLPIGAQIYGRPFEDAVVLRLARAFQRVTDHHERRPPVHGRAEVAG